MKLKTVLGVERLDRLVSTLRGARVGLVCNQASVNHNYQHSADVLLEQKGFKLTTLFGPQHGIRGDVQDNMIESPHTFDEETGLPVYSLYSETREPTEQMLEDVDAIVFDLQDVGCRIYTFIYTLANCMRAARKLGKKIVVCDRPNPINGIQVEGTVLEVGHESFVGQFPLATRHGMTVCELAAMFNDHWGINCELDLILMEGWDRKMWFDETDIPWVLPSPNMPTLETATVFPGTVHLEGTNMSEGRGTTRPFELIGAPYINSHIYAKTLESYHLPGVKFRASNFLPTFQKWAGESCGGVQIHVTDRNVFQPVVTGIAVIKAAYALCSDEFNWKVPPYEYEYNRNPFDVISGTDKLRHSIVDCDSVISVQNSWVPYINKFEEERASYLYY